MNPELKQVIEINSTADETLKELNSQVKQT